MNAHEYQAKELLREYGVPVPLGMAAASAAEAMAAAESLGSGPWVVKAQIHAGGRGKAGGVKLAQDLVGVADAARAMLGTRLRTHQTGPAGALVNRIYVEKASRFERELYLAVVLDRSAERLAVVASPDGGMDIEAVAARTPERIHTTYVEPGRALWDFQARRICFALGLEGALLRQGAELIHALTRLAVEKDATLVEINPLAVTDQGGLAALDAKINIDDSALFRQPGIATLADPNDADALERAAQEQGLNYVRLDGVVGTMVNGAGLAMATVDAVKKAGVEPANFLDVGGGASEDMVAAGFRIILGDPGVRVVLVNIFGGILRCDVLAKGITAAARQVSLPVPLVIRLEGTNQEEGRRVLQESGLDYETAASLDEGAAKAAVMAGAGR